MFFQVPFLEPFENKKNTKDAIKNANSNLKQKMPKIVLSH